MKKIVLVLVMVAMVGAVSAQELALGVKGGVNMSNFIGSDAKDAKMKIGFNVGLAADYEFAPNMAVQSGLFFTTKGAKGDLMVTKATIDLMYLQVPVHFAYKMDVTPGTRVVLHAGPYIAYGVSGKLKVDGADKSIDLFKEYDIAGKKVAAMQRFDAGLGIGVGTEFGQFLVDLGWDAGLVKLNKDAKMNNMNGYLSVGYRF